ncbi:CHC2 zinc finger domain-containing protein (plasmid) [Rossellomorea sp. AcN35-11]|nr:DUF3854 domain-containing protein [Rossellomorea aquimaris]WJV32306.1 CHC2 zinc finger domain-containing protein [Rossellomorea sp. AcN35-11]
MPLISQKTIEDIESVPVLDIAIALGYSPRRAGKQYEILCPNCDGKNTFIDPTRNIFKCFGNKISGECGCAGNTAISFYNWHKHKSNERKNFVDCVEGIAEEMGITVEYKNGTTRESGQPRRTFRKFREEVQTPAADPETVDKVYRYFLSMCPINKSHAEEWMGERGYSVEDVKTLLLRTVPSPEKAALILKTLKQKGFPLERIPGFTQRFIPYEMDYPEELVEEDKENGGYWIWMITAKSGYFIPVRDEYGRITRLRVRREKGKPKYIWFSSGENFKNEPEKLRWMKGGASSGAPLNIVPPTELLSNWQRNGELSDFCEVSTLISTEGEHKSQISANILKKVIVGVPGVGNYRSMLPLLKKWSVKKLIIAYDMDSLKNDDGSGKNQQVFDFLIAFANEALKLGIEVCVWTWDPKHGKGLDDLLVNNRLPVEINLRTKERTMVDSSMIA